MWWWLFRLPCTNHFKTKVSETPLSYRKWDLNLNTPPGSPGSLKKGIRTSSETVFQSALIDIKTPVWASQSWRLLKPSRHLTADLPSCAETELCWHQHSFKIWRQKKIHASQSGLTIYIQVHSLFINSEIIFLLNLMNIKLDNFDFYKTKATL